MKRVDFSSARGNLELSRSSMAVCLSLVGNLIFAEFLHDAVEPWLFFHHWEIPRRRPVRVRRNPRFSADSRGSQVYP